MKLFAKILQVGLATEPLPVAATKSGLADGSEQADEFDLAVQINQRARKIFGRAVSIRQVDAGSCNCLTHTPAFAIVEGWRGAIVHWVMGDRRGCLSRVKIVDPSFLNWPALSRAVPGTIVPDFPLCNKSFNMSYSGNDL